MRMQYIKGRLDEIQYCAEQLPNSCVQARKRMAKKIADQVTKIRRELDKDQNSSPT